MRKGYNVQFDTPYYLCASPRNKISILKDLFEFGMDTVGGIYYLLYSLGDNTGQSVYSDFVDEQPNSTLTIQSLYVFQLCTFFPTC